MFSPCVSTTIDLVTDRTSWVAARVGQQRKPFVDWFQVTCPIASRNLSDLSSEPLSLIRAFCLRSGCSRANRIANKCPTEYPYVFFCSILLIIPTFWVSDRTEMVHITSHIDSRYCIDATAHLDIFPIICAVWYNYYVASSTVFLPKSIHKCICHNINWPQCLDDVSPLCITKLGCLNLFNY